MAKSRKPIRMVTIKLPLGGLNDKEYFSEHVDVHLGTGSAESQALARCRIGLNAGSSRLKKNGRHVESHNDVIRYIFEQIAEQIDGPT